MCLTYGFRFYFAQPNQIWGIPRRGCFVVDEYSATHKYLHSQRTHTRAYYSLSISFSLSICLSLELTRFRYSMLQPHSGTRTHKHTDESIKARVFNIPFSRYTRSHSNTHSTNETDTGKSVARTHGITLFDDSASVCLCLCMWMKRMIEATNASSTDCVGVAIVCSEYLHQYRANDNDRVCPVSLMQ